MRDWHARYQKAGLTIVGVHSPEFGFEHEAGNVERAIAANGIRYPVVQDNDFTIWNRWGVRAWPTTVLVDKRGTLRYRHIGEGAYAETEDMIRQLLGEGG